MASAPLVKIADTGGKSFNRLTQQVNNFSNRFNRLGASINDIDKKLDQLQRTRRMTVDSSQLRRVNQEIEQLERRKASLEGTGARGGGMGIGRNLMAAAGIAGGLALFGGVANAGMQREATNMRFEVMAGKEQGGKLSSNLTDFAQKSIYGNEVFGGAQTMMAFGVQAQKVMPYMKMLGDVAMGDAQRLGSLTLAFSQVTAAGKLMGQDLLQFVNAGFNPLQEIAKKTGKSLATLRQEMSDGKISAADVVDAFQRATGASGKFYQMTQKLNKTAFGQWQALKGSVEGLAASIGTKLLPIISQLVGMGQFLVDNTEFLYGMVAAWGAYTIAVEIAALATKGLTVWQALWNTLIALNPIGLLISGIILLCTWIYHLCKQYEGWTFAVLYLGKAIEAFGSGAGSAFKDFIQEMEYWLQMGTLRLRQFLDFVRGAKTSIALEIKVAQTQRQIQRKQNLADAAESMRVMKDSWGKMGSSIHKKKGTAPGADPSGGLTPEFGSSIPSTAAETNKGITGGGVRNITINISKFLDNINIHPATMTEGANDIEDTVGELFLRVVNSASQAMT